MNIIIDWSHDQKHLPQPPKCQANFTPKREFEVTVQTVSKNASLSNRPIVILDISQAKSETRMLISIMTCLLNLHIIGYRLVVMGQRNECCSKWVILGSWMGQKNCLGPKKKVAQNVLKHALVLEFSKFNDIFYLAYFRSYGLSKISKYIEMY